MSSPTPEVLVERDADALARRVADRLLRALAGAQAEGRVPSMVLTGGTIADKIHAAVADLAEGSAVDWSRVDVWWGDERFVPPGDPERNALQARRALLDHLPLDPDRVHEVPAAGDGTDVVAAAAAYSRDVGEHSGDRFDVLMLGVGPDGHVASLFPGHPQLDVDDRAAVAVSDSPKPPPQRVSLTYRTLNRAAEVWFVVSGDAKAEAVRRALDGEDPHEVPAAGVAGQERTLWLLDEAAASRL